MKPPKNTVYMLIEGKPTILRLSQAIELKQDIAFTLAVCIEIDCVNNSVLSAILKTGVIEAAQRIEGVTLVEPEENWQYLFKVACLEDTDPSGETTGRMTMIIQPSAKIHTSHFTEQAQANLPIEQLSVPLCTEILICDIDAAEQICRKHFLTINEKHLQPIITRQVQQKQQ